MLQLMQQKESDNSKDPTRWNPLLLSVAQDRSRAAFLDLFEHFAPLIKAYAFKVTELSKAEILAEELAQDEKEEGTVCDYVEQFFESRHFQNGKTKSNGVDLVADGQRWC